MLVALQISKSVSVDGVGCPLDANFGHLSVEFLVEPTWDGHKSHFRSCAPHKFDVCKSNPQRWRAIIPKQDRRQLFSEEWYHSATPTIIGETASCTSCMKRIGTSQIVVTSAKFLFWCTDKTNGARSCQS